MAAVRHEHRYSRELMVALGADAETIQWDPFPPKLSIGQMIKEWRGPRVKAVKTGGQGGE